LNKTLTIANTESGSIVAIDSTILAKVIESVSEVEFLGAVVVDVWLPGVVENIGVWLTGVVVKKFSFAELSPFLGEGIVFRF